MSGMHFICDPLEIERKSFEIIDSHIPAGKFGSKELWVLKRVIHATADFDYVETLRISDDAIDAGIDAFKKGVTIVTDTKMVAAGINKKALNKWGCNVKCYIDDPDVASYAKNNCITRSMAAMIKAVEEPDNRVFAIGNAPTALYQLVELVKNKKARPDLIIGVPVGFVGAAESKELLKALDIPYITIEGRKGGSTIAAAIVNALLYMA